MKIQAIYLLYEQECVFVCTWTRVGKTQSDEIKNVVSEIRERAQRDIALK